MGNATSLFNLMRNIGGSIGIAMTGTMLARNQQAIDGDARRARHAVRPGVADRCSRRCAAAFMAAGADAVHGDRAAPTRRCSAWCSGRRRWCRSSDIFQLLGIVFLLLIPLVLLMKRPGSGAPPVGAH